MLKKLNLGCGPDYRESTSEVEWVNVDNGNCKVDQPLDLEWMTWPMENDTFDEIHAIQVLEHVHKDAFFRVIRNMYRVSKNNCEWIIASPHGFSENFITDPTHQMPFANRTFDYFVDGTELRELGVIYGLDDIHLEKVAPAVLDGNGSLNFHLRVKK